ncbi:unnamed protein product [Rhizophagus irregularis]|nr:unnamed protein product [Rhizophagus irregularis]
MILPQHIFQQILCLIKLESATIGLKCMKILENMFNPVTACQRRGKSRSNQMLHPIAVHGPFYQVGIDFVGPLPITSQGNKYIIVAIDYMTKWPEAKAVPVATAEETSQFIYEDIICRHGCPEKIIIRSRNSF